MPVTPLTPIHPSRRFIRSLKQRKTLLASSVSLSLLACGGGGGEADSPSVRASADSGALSQALSSTSRGEPVPGYTATLPATADARPPRVPTPAPAPPVDAVTRTDTSAPLLLDMGNRTYSAPATVGGLHNPANYKIAPRVPTWQFASSDPTNGVLSFEREVAPDIGWHGYSRKGKVIVTGGSGAAANRVYTVFNKEQLLAAIREARNEPKIIRIVGHIDFRWRDNNTVFEEYTSYEDQKFGGSLSIPSNTTLVGINDSQGRPARITGTTLLIGKEAALTPTGDPEADFKAWVAQGKDPELYPTWTRNIIVRNLAIDTPWDVNPEDSGNAYADGMTITRGQHIWIDHIQISDGDTPDSLASDTRHDGALDIVRGSDYVTVSNSVFTKHHKTTLIGNGDSGRAWSDAGRLHVTLTGNWWNHAGARLPLVRFGQVHLYNNLVAGSTSTSDSDLKFDSGLQVRYQSDVISESNFYEFTGLKPREICGKLALGNSAISFRSSGHRFISDKDDNGQPMSTVIDAQLQGCDGLPVANNWVPPYGYTLRHADNLRAGIKASAGAGRLGAFAVVGPTPAPVPGSPSPSPAPVPTPPPPPPAPAPSPVDPGGEPAQGCSTVLPCGNGSGEVVLSTLVTAAVPNAVFDPVSGTYTLNGAGNMSNSNSYNFNLKYTPLVGDFTFTARLLNQGGTVASARAGIVAITTLDTTAAYAWTARYASTGEIRAAINGDGKAAISGYSSSTPPVWVRIRRSGTALYSGASNDGVTWTEKTNLGVSATTLLVGLGLSSGSNTSAVQAQFDNVSIVGGGR